MASNRQTLTELWLQWLADGQTPLSVIESLQHSRNIKTSEAAREVVRIIRDRQKILPRYTAAST